MTKRTVTFRISEKVASLLDSLTKQGPYVLTKSSVVERGIVLAAEELKENLRHK